MRVRAYAAPAKGAALEPWSYEAGELAPDEVELAVHACSLCHSDLHLVDDDWGISRYPLVPGHEAVGRVVATGRAVTSLAAGDWAGVGWQRSSCGRCELCATGHANLCLTGKKRTCVDQPGGFAERVRASEAFTFKLPAALDPKTAAPLLCAGVTTFAPLKRHVKAGQRVAILGLGGLGHLAVQFAAKMGSEVTALDPVAAKAAEAKRLGAARFHAVSSEAEARALAMTGERYDVLLTTTSAALPWDAWLDLVAPLGTFCTAGVPPGPLTFSADHLIDGQKTVTGSAVGSPEDMRATLEFAAKHGVAPITEHLPLAQVNEALARMRKGAARYRIVLHTES